MHIPSRADKDPFRVRAERHACHPWISRREGQFVEEWVSEVYGEERFLVEVLVVVEEDFLECVEGDAEDDSLRVVCDDGCGWEVKNALINL